MDQKIKTSAKKPPLGMIPARALIGPSRVYGYGGRKYAPGNYYNAELADGAGSRYVSAALRHLGEMQLPNGLHTDESLAALDDESGLPHIDHAICGLLMLRAIMTKCGALEADPGEGNDPHAVPKIVHRAGCELGEPDGTRCDCGVAPLLGSIPTGWEPARMQSTCPLGMLGDEGSAVPLPVVHDDAKCLKEPHTHSWNVPLSERGR